MRVWQDDGAKTGSAWLAWKQRVPIQVARQRVRHARALRTLPAVEAAWAAGGIDRAQHRARSGRLPGRGRRQRGPEWLDRYGETSWYAAIFVFGLWQAVGADTPLEEIPPEYRWPGRSHWHPEG